MESKLVLYNTLTRRKEVFEPLNEGRVGMYVCGPTVYGDPHLGHTRPAVTFDLMFRYLKALGYKVRYVRNITDVGHLEHDADEGEDKIAKKARLEQLEPMEVAHYYTERYRKAMEQLNVLSPSIEPHASGHIIEQIDFFSVFLMRATPTSRMVRYISMSRSIMQLTTTDVCQVVILTILLPTPAFWMVNQTSNTPLISPSGRKLHLNILCVGDLLGATASPAGTWSVQQ